MLQLLILLVIVALVSGAMGFTGIAAGAATLVVVRLRDRFGNAVGGARSDLAVSVSGANPGAQLSVSSSRRRGPVTAGAD